MAYELTVAGYTFENPPESYRKQIDLGNSDQRAFQRQASSFYQSDSQDLKFEVSGTLALDKALGGTDDLAELEKLQDLAIDGGEVRVEFDPFFSGRCIIEDDPFEQADGESSYSFRFTVNSVDTDPSAYPSHTEPDTGNTFEFGNLNLGYDPDSVRQNYDRNVETVDRLSGISRSVDTKGLVPEVQITGNIDGAGQADLWQKARDNVLAYLSAEFQNGWALMDRLEITNNPDAPHYLEGMFRYRLKCYIVMDPGSGIGSVSKAVDRNVKDLDSYVSNCDDDGIFERLGQDDDEYPYALDFRVSGGTGQLRGDYLQWDEGYGTLDQNTTNYLFVEDPEENGYGQVNRNTSGFPSTSVALWEVETTSTEIIQIQDQRSCLMGERRGTAEGDLNFLDDLAVNDRRIDFERFVRLSESLGVNVDHGFPWLGLAEFDPEQFGVNVDHGFPWLTTQAFDTETPAVGDGGSAGGAGGDEQITESYSTGADFDTGTSTSVVHDNFGDYPGDDVVQLGVPRNLSDLEVYLPVHEDSGSSISDASGNGRDATLQNGSLGATGIVNTTSVSWGGSSSNDYIRTDSRFTSPFTGGEATVLIFMYMRESFSSDNHWMMNCYKDRNDRMGFFGNSNDSRAYLKVNDSVTEADWNSEPSTGQWHLLAVRGSDSLNRFDTWLDDQQRATTSGINGGNISDITSDVHFAMNTYGPSLQSGYTTDCKQSHGMVFSRYLSDSELTNLYNAMVNGSLVLATKSFDQPVKPDLVDLNYTLNGESISIDVTGSPGEPEEETITQVLDGSASYSLAWNESHTDFQPTVNISTGDKTVSPTISALGLEGTVSTGATQNPNTHWEIRGAKHDTSGNIYEGNRITSIYGG